MIDKELLQEIYLAQGHLRKINDELQSRIIKEIKDERKSKKNNC